MSEDALEVAWDNYANDDESELLDDEAWQQYANGGEKDSLALVLVRRMADGGEVIIPEQIESKPTFLWKLAEVVAAAARSINPHLDANSCDLAQSIAILGKCADNISQLVLAGKGFAGQATTLEKIMAFDREHQTGEVCHIGSQVHQAALLSVSRGYLRKTRKKLHVALLFCTSGT